MTEVDTLWRELDAADQWYADNARRMVDEVARPLPDDDSDEDEPEGR